MPIQLSIAAYNAAVRRQNRDTYERQLPAVRTQEQTARLQELESEANAADSKERLSRGQLSWLSFSLLGLWTFLLNMLLLCTPGGPAWSGWRAVLMAAYLHSWMDPFMLLGTVCAAFIRAQGVARAYHIIEPQAQPWSHLDRMLMPDMMFFMSYLAFLFEYYWGYLADAPPSAAQDLAQPSLRAQLAFLERLVHRMMLLSRCCWALLILRLAVVLLVDPWFRIGGKTNYLMSILCNGIGRLVLQTVFTVLRPQFTEFRKMRHLPTQ